jgi:hypothetical protein
MPEPARAWILGEARGPGFWAKPKGLTFCLFSKSPSPSLILLNKHPGTQKARACSIKPIARPKPIFCKPNPALVSCWLWKVHTCLSNRYTHKTGFARWHRYFQNAANLKAKRVTVLVKFVRTSQQRQGCQRYQKFEFGKIMRAMEWKMLVYFMVTCNLLRTFGIFYDHLAYFVVIWYNCFPFFCFYRIYTLQYCSS